MKLLLVACFSLRILSSWGQISSTNNYLRKTLLLRTATNTIYTLLVEGENRLLIQAANDLDFKINYNYQNISSITCNAAQLAALIETKVIQRAELIPANKQPLNDTMLYRNRLKEIKLWTAPLPQAYDGSGVIIGIIDTGIDFNHPDFKDALGKTRINYLWDQTATLGPVVPQPYNYGIEWNAAQINANLCTHSDMANYGHGTGVSSIAAGNGFATGRFEGVAPKSDVIVVAIDFNKVGPTIADAVNFILTKAQQLGKPFVINASLGNYYGSHDATDLESKLIEAMIKNTAGRAMVAAAGNAGHIKFHVKTQTTNDTAFTWIKNTTTLLNYWCYADTLQIKNVEISVGANRANYTDLGTIGYKNYAYALNSIKYDTLKHNNQRIGIVQSAASINSSGVYELSIGILADSLNLLWRIETAGNGLHDAWNFDFVSTGLPNSSQFPKINKYVLPDSLSNMVSGFQCSNEILTVGNYVNLQGYLDVNNNPVNTLEIAGDLAPSSSSGPTRDNRQKPDIAATGNNVFGAMALGMQSSLITNAPHVVAQGSVHVLAGGTSAASPVVAGLAALYLQKNPQATNQDVIAAIRNCAYQDSYTSSNLPHPRWGYGKLDGKAAMLCDQPIVNGFDALKTTENVKVYPNPFEETIHIILEEHIAGTLFVYTSLGDLVYQKTVTCKHCEINLEDLHLLPSSLVFVSIVSQNKTYSFKLIKN